MLIAWFIGWAFTVNLVGKTRVTESLSLLLFWPMELGSYVRSKLE